MAAALLQFPGAPAPEAATPAIPDNPDDFLSIEKLRRQFYDYLGAATAEIAERVEADRYDAGSQWTAEEIAVLKKRKQPVVTFNLMAPKYNAVVGIVERLRQDPKAYPRTPKEQDGADLATAVLRFALEENDWKGKHPRVARFGARDAIAGIEYDLERGDVGDPDVRMHLVYPDTFFYDKRSYDEGFTDARFMGVAKWVDVEQAKEIVPDKAAEIDDLVETGSDLTMSSDREVAWINSNSRRLRLIDHWYIRRGEWRWALYVGTTILMEGTSPFKDERGKTFPKYRMFSGGVDQDGDRYCFHRQWKDAQDEYNHRRSKSLHLMNSRRVRATKGIVDDVEVARREEARADGWIEMNPVPNGQYVTDDQRQMADMRAHLELMKEAQGAIENFGPNLALLGQGLQDSSGRAIALLQQAGMAQLGPYLSAFKNWKIRVYRDLWNIIQQHWKAERWIRVTDDENLAQWFKINEQKIDPFGRPYIVNDVGSLDVDFVLDEGPDAINMQADNLGVLQTLGPNFAEKNPDIVIELLPLQGSLKKTLLSRIEQAKNTPPPPDPKVEAMKAQIQFTAQQNEMDLKFQAAKHDQELTFKRETNAMQLQMQREQLDVKREQMHLDDVKDLRKHAVDLHHGNMDRDAAAASNGQEQKVSASINYKDLPPDGQQQLAADAGLDIALPDPPPEPEPAAAPA